MQQSDELYKEKMKDLYIETVSGNKFFIANPVFDLNDIASALSKLCRFNGHCKQFYSVAAHSILVSEIMESLGDGTEHPLEGLLHDATEAYLADIPSPWKVLLPQYKTVEKQLDAHLRQQFHLPETITDKCKYADYLALFVEAHYLIPTRGYGWPAPEGMIQKAKDYIVNYNPDLIYKDSYGAFLKRYVECTLYYGT